MTLLTPLVGLHVKRGPAANTRSSLIGEDIQGNQLRAHVGAQRWPPCVVPADSHTGCTCERNSEAATNSASEQDQLVLNRTPHIMEGWTNYRCLIRGNPVSHLRPEGFTQQSNHRIPLSMVASEHITRVHVPFR